MRKQIIFLTVFFLFIMQNTNAESLFEDNFQDPSQWKFISDNVMGGVSTGKISYISNDNNFIAFMSGKVSTKNNGGFIQIRRKLNDIDLKKTRYIKIIAKGNNQKYFIHLRTSGTILPWQYYQLDFSVNNKYEEFILPIKEFKRSGSFLTKEVNAKHIKSIGIAAIGRDHDAEIYIKEIIFLE